MEKKVETLSREIVKPSAPTPNHLKTLKLSLPDILSSAFYTGALLFYAADHQKCPVSSQEISLKLKKSLSDTLTIFYPLAGRINGCSIDCNDEGAVFVEARVDCLLSDFLQNPVPESLELLIPDDAHSSKPVSWPVLLIQANFFSCGGLSITVCPSHKITDATSLVMFIRGWADSTRGLGITMIPEFTASDYFPAPHVLPFKEMGKVDFEQTICVTKRFVFDAGKIKELKTRTASALVKNPTRVEAVTALLWRCATKASRSSSETLKTSVLQLVVNLRRWVSSLSENTIGNLLSFMILQNERREMEEIMEVVGELRKKKEQFSSTSNERFSGGDKSSMNILEFVKEMVKLYSRTKDLELYTSNSWCKLQIYEADFGWGKPVWVTGRGTSIFKNLMLLLDAKDGEGVEAWITLSQEHMKVLEHDTEFLEFASLNPPPLS
ncbi:PREDICTED: BAHD acyltransferase At5g47980-like [Tarenaya hassleriana]|uniref:BAHD acyltransferase At5g47980-like n=1 Tax=Tarenaya hassleriana TaxID=28532 RepID=UPI00053C384C|nr:PREDICTED: BAHD acyltransferase At5g47980-like [Tarenaya hassleriana]